MEIPFLENIKNTLKAVFSSAQSRVSFASADPAMPMGVKNRRTVLLSLILSAVFLMLLVLYLIDVNPSTSDAYVFASSIRVIPEAKGTIVELNVRDNQFVKQGELLFVVDPEPYAQELAKAQAALKAMQFTGDAANQLIIKAQSGFNLAESTYKRMAPLIENHYVSTEDLDQARTKMLAAQSDLKAALNEGEKVKAAIDGIKAEISLAEINIGYTHIKAPFDGNIVGLKTSVGQFVTPPFPVFTLINASDWFVIGNFRETELKHIKPGSPAEVYLMNDSSKKFKGTVDSIGFGVLPDDGAEVLPGLPLVARTINWVRVAQRFPVKIRIDQPDAALFRIGVSAVVTVHP